MKVRVMTYNVHSCRGLDGRVLPERIARIIEEYDPDLVALQELDVNRKWSNRIDQPLVIAQHLRMECHFQPAIAIEGERYGIAVMSRYPFEIKKAVGLPAYAKPSPRKMWPLFKYYFEPRHAVWTSITIKGRVIYFVNTHLSLRSPERLEQIKSIVGQEWLNMSSHKVPTILCGDFNEGPRSCGHRLLKTTFDEVKASLGKKVGRKTFLSPWPLFEVDHIFFNGAFKATSVSIPSTPLTRIASDHLPVIAEFTLEQGNP